MSVLRTSLTFGRLSNASVGIGFGIASVCALAGCACPITGSSAASPAAINPSAAATRPQRARVIAASTSDPISRHRGARSSDDDGPVKNAVQHTAVDPKLLKKAEPPSCRFDGVTKPPRGSGRPGAYADPNLMEIARLQLVSDCYKVAERAVRERLAWLQTALVKPASDGSTPMKKAEPPLCEIEGAGTAGSNTERNLEKIAQLRRVGECYKAAERAARTHLERLQSSFRGWPVNLARPGL